MAVTEDELSEETKQVSAEGTRPIPEDRAQLRTAAAEILSIYNNDTLKCSDHIRDQIVESKGEVSNMYICFSIALHRLTKGKSDRGEFINQDREKEMEDAKLLEAQVIQKLKPHEAIFKRARMQEKDLSLLVHYAVKRYLRDSNSLDENIEQFKRDPYRQEVNRIIRNTIVEVRKKDQESQG